MTPRPRTSGVPGRVAVLLSVAVALAAAAVDLGTGRGLALGPGFATAFLAGSALAALLVRRSRLAVAALAPPLVYAGLMLAAGLASGVPLTVPRQGVELFTRLILGAPVLIGGTAIAVVVTVLRGHRRRLRRS